MSALRKIFRYEKYIFYTLLACLLIPIWSTIYFLTLDGPCHLYNAKILKDLWLNNHTAFYEQFYYLNKNLDPNWFSHVALALLMLIVKPLLAEKILLSIYIIIFAVSARLLVGCINRDNKILAILVLPFICHRTFQMGFYNYCFSLAFMVTTVWFFVWATERFNIVFTIVVSLLLFTLTYMAHPIGYLIAVGTCGGILFFEAAGRINSFGFNAGIVKPLGKKAAILAFSVLPSVILLYLFMQRRSSYQVVSNPEGFGSLSQSLWLLRAITNLSKYEDIMARVICILCAMLVVGTLLKKVLATGFNKYDVFGLGTAALLLFYFFAPAGIAGAGMVSVRLLILPFILFIFWVASVNWRVGFKTTVALIFGICTFALVAVRLPVHVSSSHLIEEYATAMQYVKPKSVVLPLNYSHTGIDPGGKPLNDRSWICTHSIDYLGAEKPLIILDNYEANTGYFPLIWHPQKNPFTFLAKAGTLSIELIPPLPDIEPFEHQTGHKIDYVFMLCLTNEYGKHPNTLDVLSQLKKNYRKVYTGPTGRVVLYERI